MTPQHHPRPKTLGRSVKEVLIGKRLSLDDHGIFHNISLIAFFAWVGLGADGLSSSCYGPEEAFLALGEHSFLAIFVALASAVTIVVISLSYSQIIEYFPSGGGGYMVASKLLSPKIGMVSGCALLIDYVLTIAISVASGADAVFSFLPPDLLPYKMYLALAGVLILLILNLRGVKESVMVLVPIFMVFVVTHAFVIGYAIVTHLFDLPAVTAKVAQDVDAASSQLGGVGMIVLILHAYGMGAGTYTGIEAVSNGLPILREPKVKTGKRTMLYMSVSLAVTVVGLMVAYLLFDVGHVPGKTLNAVLFERATAAWPAYLGNGFVWLTLVSEALLLVVAAQAGFLDGPRVLANMSLDRWFPTRFSMLSDRLVGQNGVLLMGLSSALLMLLTSGSVAILIVLYSINVFITFVLSQLGMVRHWWHARGTAEPWRRGLTINGIGLALCIFILVTVTVMKFHDGGWVTLVVTAALAFLALRVRSHYDQVGAAMRKLDYMTDAVAGSAPPSLKKDVDVLATNPNAKTAVVLVSGFNGLGVHTFMSVMRIFGSSVTNLVFVQIGVVDAYIMRSPDELDKLKERIRCGVESYVDVAREWGYSAEGICSLGTDVVEEILYLAPQIMRNYPKAIFFGGQLVFRRESMWTKFLHNYVVLTLQRQLYKLGVPFMVMPILLDFEEGVAGAPKAEKAPA